MRRRACTWGAFLVTAAVLVGAAAPASARSNRPVVDVTVAPLVVDEDGWTDWHGGSEGGDEPAPAVVQLTRRGKPGPALTVDYRTQDRELPYTQEAGHRSWSAEAHLDYTPVAGRVVFPAGSPDGTSLVIEVPVLEDDIQEPPGTTYGAEYFDFVVSSEGADVAEWGPVAVFDDDDSAPEPCHCFISGIKVYGCVPGTECNVCCTLTTGPVSASLARSACTSTTGLRDLLTL